MRMNSLQFSARWRFVPVVTAGAFLVAGWSLKPHAYAGDRRPQSGGPARTPDGRHDREHDGGAGHGSSSSAGSRHANRPHRGGDHDRHPKRLYGSHHDSHHGPSHPSVWRGYYGSYSHHYHGWYRPTWYAPRYRSYRGIHVYRPYGHCYSGYAWFRADDDAYSWLAFTAISLKLLDSINEAQQREHEAAQIRATSAPIGERIVWTDGGVSGSVTALRDGTAASGRYCREFLHEVRIGGRAEQAYGTACQQPDGAWEIVSTGP